MALVLSCCSAALMHAHFFHSLVQGGLLGVLCLPWTRFGCNTFVSEVFLVSFDFLDPAMAASDPWLRVLFISYLRFAFLVRLCLKVFLMFVVFTDVWGLVLLLGCTQCLPNLDTPLWNEVFLVCFAWHMCGLAAVLQYD